MSFKQKPASSLRNTIQIVFWLAAIILLGGLIALMVSGWFSRYLQDDYCFDFLLKHHGFWNAQVFTFFNEITFNGNRFSTNLVMGVLAQIGPVSARLLPGFLVIVWLAAAVWLLQELNHLFKWHWPISFIFFVSTSLVLFSLVQSPNLYQVLFWRPAAVTYLMPLVLLTFLLALILHFIGNDHSILVSILISALLAFWIGGYSETAAVFQSGLWMIVLIWSKVKNPFDLSLHKTAERLFYVALVGSLLAILVLVLAPSAHLRQTALFPQPPQILNILRISLDGIRQFLLLTLYRHFLSTLVIFLLFFYAGFLFAHFTKQGLALRKPKLWFHLLQVLFSAMFLLLCVAMPSAFASSAIPEARALLWARFIVVVTLIIISMLMGDWMGRYISHPTRRRVLFASGLFFSITAIILILLVPAKTAFQPAYPEIRDWLEQHSYWAAIFILLFIVVLWVIGRVKLEKRYIEEWIPSLLMALILSISLLSLPELFKAIPEYQVRAELWDWRDAKIRTAILRGNYEIELPALDSIAGITELQENPDHWVNNCAELYYGMKSIRAVPPILTAVPQT